MTGPSQPGGDAIRGIPRVSWAPEAGEVQPHYLVDNPVGTCGRQALLGLSDQPELSQVPGRERKGQEEGQGMGGGGERGRTQ